MVEKKVELHFSRDIVGKPVISRVIGEYKVSVNILRASITPDEAGEMFVIMSGETAALNRAIRFLRKSGVGVAVESRLFSFDEVLCVHCGACVAHCFVDAFTVDAKTARVSWDEKTCVSCGICIPACGYGALSLVSPTPRAAKGGRK
jgi:heterodisulfide reductase subunit A-like polyferredoxin